MKKINTVLPIEELIGTTYGRLTIVEEIERHQEPNGKKQRVMLCKCDCGNNYKVQLKDIRAGRIVSCGCYANGKRLSLNGVKEFGKWKVVDDENFGVKVKVICACGKENVIHRRALLIGESKSCGKCRVRATPLPLPKITVKDTEDEKWKPCFNGECMISDKGSFLHTKKNIIVDVPKGVIRYQSKSHNLYNILYESFYGTFDTSNYVVIKIDDDLPVTLDNLFLAHISGNVYSRTWIKRLQANMRANGNRLRSITKKHIIEKYKEQNGLSYFLKLPLDLSMKSDLLAVSIDRMDNSVGYTPDNFTLVTRFENMGRRSNTFEQMQEFANTYLNCNH